MPNGDNDSMFEPWGKLALKYGAWSALAIFLVYRLDGKFDEGLTATRLAAEAARAAIEQHATNTSPIANGMVQLVNLQLQQCVNAADDFLKRSKCFDAMWATPQRGER